MPLFFCNVLNFTISQAELNKKIKVFKSTQYNMTKKELRSWAIKNKMR